MPLDDETPIPPLESQTIRAAVSAIVLNALTLLTILGGKTFDVAMIQHYIDLGVPMAVNVATMYFGWRAYQGRVNATKTIAKKE